MKEFLSPNIMDVIVDVNGNFLLNVQTLHLEGESRIYHSGYSASLGLFVYPHRSEVKQAGKSKRNSDSWKYITK